MKKYRFLEIFKEEPDGSLTTIRKIKVNGVIFNIDTSFTNTICIGGINFHMFKHLDIAVEEMDNLLIIKGFYK